MLHSLAGNASAFLAAASIAFFVSTHPSASTAADYGDLLSLFSDWREFQKPQLVDGVPDYSASAMSLQHSQLPSYKRRLADIDPSDWPVAQQVDWALVLAEMNALDFDHRILRPWENNPAFYVTVFPTRSDQPAREGPHAYGAVELWTYTFPLSEQEAEQMDAGIRTIPQLLEQARRHLTGNGHDLWSFGAGSIREQSKTLEQLASRLTGAPAQLRTNVQRAKDATDAFADWLDARVPFKKGQSGVGVEHYSWYLKNVHFLPYTWQDEVTLMERELARAHAFLALEEKRNAALPEAKPIASAEEHERRFNEAIAEYMTFLRDNNVLTVREFMEPALRGRIGEFRAGTREFFTEVNYRDPLVMRTHDYHWFDLARMTADPHQSPIRRDPLLYNIFITRTEGLATGWEEMMLQAGLFDGRPRSRELVYILLAQRAARALGDLRMHSNDFTLEEAAQFTSENTPRGWLSLGGRTVRSEQHLYLQQPSYGTSYVVGKIQIEALLAAQRDRLGEAFTIRRFMDEFEAAGLIPVPLIRWQLTGQKPGVIETTLTARR